MQTPKEHKLQRRNLSHEQIQRLKLFLAQESNHDSLFPHRLECDYAALKLFDVSNEFGGFAYLCEIISDMLLDIAKLLATGRQENQISTLEHYEFLHALQTIFNSLDYVDFDKR